MSQSAASQVHQGPSSTSTQQQQQHQPHNLLATPAKGMPGITKTPPTPQRPAEQLQKDLQYLREHKVCEKLEFIVKNLLQNQPEDPILAICNMLRESNHGRSSVRSSAAGSVARGLGGGSGGPAMGGSSSNGQTAAGASNNLTSPSAASSQVGSPVDAHSPSFEAAVTQHRSRADGGAGGVLGGSSGGGAHGGAGQAPTGSRPYPASRVGTPGSAAGGSGLAGLARRDSFGIQSNGTGGGRYYDRDETARSDASDFSITSVDMTEFLAEFRSAHFSLFGGTHEQITKQELTDIIDRVALPLPDVRMLFELFAELDDGSGLVTYEAFLARMNFKIQGRYPIDVIRNIYFSLLGTPAPSPSSTGSAGSPNSTNGGSSGVAAATTTGAAAKLPKLMSYGSVQDLAGVSKATSHTNSPVQPQSLTAPALPQHLVSIAPAPQSPASQQHQQQQQQISATTSPSLLMAASQQQQQQLDQLSELGVGHTMSSRAASAPPSKTLSAAVSTTTAHATEAAGGATGTTSTAAAATLSSSSTGEAGGGITRRQCLEDGLWKGLGIRLGATEFAKVAKHLGIPDDDSFVFHVSDFTRLVQSVTGQQQQQQQQLQLRDPLELSDYQQ